ncbi:hypothetical protein [Kitasatospora sp. CB01950]|uniref:hypothetical protein n=1 Tax=Kitasatospora sp. CB01950 TaxID=1703930 RepID=UPI00093E3502|nr:hypothetical protein [Kitasatospora sp. CB01950]OKJ17328.1 hypothetical protein AMK19_04480 [Kitasatospora sp. CB01950]
MAMLVVEVRPHRFTAWFHRVATVPVVDVDGVESAARWGVNRVPVAAGPHVLAVSFRYRGQRTVRLGTGVGELTVRHAAELPVSARLGVRNGSRFTVAAG